jgi:hypothetical protein
MAHIKPEQLRSGFYEITGSLYGTSSFAYTASHVDKAVVTASANNATITFTKGDGTTFPLTINNVVSASYAFNATTASYALTASYAANVPLTASYALNALSSSYAVTASYAATASYIDTLYSSNYTQSFVNQSTWTVIHNLNTRYVIVQVYDTTFDEIIPQNIDLTNDDTVTITFPTLESGTAVVTVGGALQNSGAVSSSYAFNATSASYALTASYFSGSITNAISASYALTASYINPTFISASAAAAGFGSGGGSVTVPGSNTQILFNSASALGASSNFTFNYTLGSLQQGFNNLASGQYSHAEGQLATASAVYSHAEGGVTRATNFYAHAEGADTTAAGIAAHSEGNYTSAQGNYSHAEGVSSISTGLGSHAEGQQTTSQGNYSHTEGYGTSTIAIYSHAEGSGTTAQGVGSHAEGNLTYANGPYSHAEGTFSSATGDFSHAEGFRTLASGQYSHTEGYYTTASGNGAHTEGYYTIALNEFSHAEGRSTITSGQYSHAEGYGTITSTFYQHTQGTFNLTSSITGAFIHGNGTDNLNRSNLIFAAGNQVEITGSLAVTGSLIVTGSTQGNVAALTISLNTASVDLTRASFFTITLTSGATTHISASNILPGSTSTILVTTDGTSNVTFSPNIKQPSGSFYTASAVSTKDILTLISYDSTNVYLASVKNLI